MDQDNEIKQDGVVDAPTTEQPIVTNEPTADQQPIDTPTEVPPVAPNKPKLSKKKKILIAVSSLLLLAGIGTGAYFLFLKKDPTPVVVEEVSKSIVEPEIFGTPEPEIPESSGLSYITPKFLDLSVSWQDPVKIEPLGYLNNEKQAPTDWPTETGEFVLVDYYLAGTFSGGKIIYVDLPFDGPGSQLEVFLVRDGQKAELLNRYSTSLTTPGQSTIIPDRYDEQLVTLNSDTILKGTWAPDTITIKGQKMKLPKYTYGEDGTYSNNAGTFSPRYSTYGDSTKTLTNTIAEGSVYEVTQAKDGYSLTLFELEMANKFRVSYVLDGEITGADVQPITWNDGSRNTSSYETFGYGCGGGSYALVVGLTTANLQQIGKTDKGQVIYGFKDMEGKVAKQLLSEVNGRNGTYIDPEKDTTFSAEEFQSARTVIMFEDAIGRVIAYKNSANYIAGGCAKPVIYLYPETVTNMSVRVGADVVISEPQYEASGWQDVTAYPNGALHYRGATYDSLFWEGRGHGTYPDIRNEGVVVANENVVSTLRDHLSRQGFNKKETEDFIEFWSVNIPDMPYVRIAWLSTSQMNQLAPLYLSTKPDTIIRTFVELEGLESPRVLTPQRFTAPIRKGFTVTEWGGLAVNGLDQLNYPDNPYPYRISLPTTW